MVFTHFAIVSPMIASDVRRRLIDLTMHDDTQTLDLLAARTA